VVWASASDTVSIVGAAARPNAAANPISERAFRREIASDLIIALMSNLPGRSSDGLVQTTYPRRDQERSGEGKTAGWEAEESYPRNETEPV
jgi:hypothetical protein